MTASAALASRRLRKLGDFIEGEVNQGLVPGAVVQVTQAGQTIYEAVIGYSQPVVRTPMRRDAVFWLASMTKPVTSVAAMMLIEAGQLGLHDLVRDYLPALRHRPEEPPIKVLDLLRHTSGVPYGAPDVSPLHALYHQAKLFDMTQDNAELAAKIARLPLLSPPGTMFEYGMSTDVLGRLIEVVSGQSLADFIGQHISGPLGLASFGFSVGETDRERIAWPLPGDDTTLAPPPFPAARWCAGGSGLWGTAQDYTRFARMLLGEGELDRVRLLAPLTVRLMTRNHLPEGVRFGPSVQALEATAPLPELGQGFGLGVMVRTKADANPVPGAVGDFGWPGLSGTTFWVDPSRQLVAVLMMRSTRHRLRYRTLFREYVYGALE